MNVLMTLARIKMTVGAGQMTRNKRIIQHKDQVPPEKAKPRHNDKQIVSESSRRMAYGNHLELVQLTARGFFFLSSSRTAIIRLTHPDAPL